MKPYRLPALFHTLILLGVLAGSHLAHADDLPLTDTAAGVEDKITTENSPAQTAAPAGTEAEGDGSGEAPAGTELSLIHI